MTDVVVAAQKGKQEEFEVEGVKYTKEQILEMMRRYLYESISEQTQEDVQILTEIVYSVDLEHVEDPKDKILEVFACKQAQKYAKTLIADVADAVANAGFSFFNEPNKEEGEEEEEKPEEEDLPRKRIKAADKEEEELHRRLAHPVVLHAFFRDCVVPWNDENGEEEEEEEDEDEEEDN